MNYAIERMRRIRDDLEATDDQKIRKTVIRRYLREIPSDLDDLADPEESTEVDLLLASLVSIYGVKDTAKTIRRVITETRAGRKRQTTDGRLREVEPGAMATLDRVLEDEAAPGPIADLMVPGGYEVGPEGILGPAHPESGERPVIAPRVVYLAGLLRDVHSGDLHVDLTWRQPFGRWASETVPRSTVADSRRLVGTSDRGVPVNSTTSSALVRFLTAFESDNRHALPCSPAANVLGWQGSNGHDGFLWGETCLGGVPETPVRLLADTGKLQIAQAYTARGDLDGWREVWNRVQPHPRIVLAIYVALAPLVLGIVPDAPGFVVDYSGRSTGGKTTTLRVASSVWGDPDQLIYQWKATLNAIEHVASFSRHLPVFLDDTKQAADNPRKVAAVIYQTTGLRGKLRASPDGLRETATFRTVLVSTGEVRATSFTEDVGAHARTLCVGGFPFAGEDAAANGHLADWLRLTCSEHYGHVGPRVVRWLYERRDEWGTFREHWRTARDREAAKDAGNAFAARSAPYLASIRFAAWILSEALDLAVHEEALEEASRWASRGARTARRHEAALHDVFGWLTSRQSSLLSKGSSTSHEVIGRWDEDEPPAVIGKSLDDFVASCGYDVEGVADEWRREGWLDAPAGRRTKQVRIGRGRPLCYVFTNAALRAVSREETPEKTTA